MIKQLQEKNREEMMKSKPDNIDNETLKTINLILKKEDQLIADTVKATLEMVIENIGSIWLSTGITPQETQLIIINKINSLK